MKKFVSLLTSMIVTLFVIGCSNPSSSSGGSLGMGGAEDNGTKIYNNSVTLNASTLEQIVKPDDLKDLEINKLIITAYNFTTTSEEAWWVTLTADDSWTTKLEKDSGTCTWSDENQGWSWTVTDSETLSKFKEGGIYIAGLSDATVTVTVSYE